MKFQWILNADSIYNTTIGIYVVGSECEDVLRSVEALKSQVEGSDLPIIKLEQSVP